MPDLKARYEAAVYRLEKQEILLMGKPGWFPGSRLWHTVRYRALLNAVLSLQKEIIKQKPKPESEEEKSEGLTGLAFRFAAKTRVILLPVLNRLEALDLVSEEGSIRLWATVMKVALAWAMILLTVFAYVLYSESGAILAQG